MNKPSNCINIICSKDKEEELLQILSKHGIKKFERHDRDFLIFKIQLPYKNFSSIKKELLLFQDNFLSSLI